MSLSMRTCTVAAALVLAVQVSGAAQAPAADQVRPPTVQEQDVLLGVWVLDLARSKYDPGPAPRSEIRSYEQDHEGVRARIHSVQADGQEANVEFLASYNDVVALVTGSQTIDAVKMRKIDAYTAEDVLSFNGKPVGKARRVVSPDGRVMTITYTTDAPTKVNNVAVYTRQRN